jgi:hypothetical protein
VVEAEVLLKQDIEHVLVLHCVQEVVMDVSLELPELLYTMEVVVEAEVVGVVLQVVVA